MSWPASLWKYHNPLSPAFKTASYSVSLSLSLFLPLVLCLCVSVMINLSIYLTKRLLLYFLHSFLASHAIFPHQFAWGKYTFDTTAATTSSSCRRGKEKKSYGEFYSLFFWFYLLVHMGFSCLFFSCFSWYSFFLALLFLDCFPTCNFILFNYKIYGSVIWQPRVLYLLISWIITWYHQVYRQRG